MHSKRKPLGSNMKDWILRWTNLSGDTFEGSYTEHEAKILFDYYQETNQQVELVPPTGNWYTVYNRTLNRIFDCWKN